jgi:RNA polymerase sigma-B factor
VAPRIPAHHDPELRERIILAYLGLADRLATRFRGNHGVAAEDLVQAARVGLVSAVDRYDPGRANPFVVYAIAFINGELRRCLRDTSWRVHVTRTLKELALQVVRARNLLTVTLDRSPRPASARCCPLRPARSRSRTGWPLPGLLDGLSDLERRAVVLRFFGDLKQKQIGAELGYSQMHVSRVLHRALRRMREQLPP